MNMTDELKLRSERLRCDKLGTQIVLLSKARRKDLMIYRLAVVGLVILHIAFYAGWVIDKATKVGC